MLSGRTFLDVENSKCLQFFHLLKNPLRMYYGIEFFLSLLFW